MMYIVRKSDKDLSAHPDSVNFGRDPKAYNWHVGEKRPRDQNGGFEDVCEVYADGHELERIRKMHTNLPDVPTAHSIVWRGDLAQFIYDHLPAFSGGLNETSHYREG